MAGLTLSAPDGVKVYSVAGAKALPAWLSEKKARAAKRDPNYARRIELVQDLGFPGACQRLKLSPDGNFLFASGTHPPRVRVYELGQLGMKFERHLDSEVVDFQILSEDYAKAAFLCADRSVCLHAKYGAHYRTRIPTAGRDLAYVSSTADLIIVGSAPEAYRLSLSEGRFLAPLPLSSPAANAVGLSSVHGLMGVAGEDGTLECFDPRQRTAVGTLSAASAAGAPGEALTAVRFDETGLGVAVGTAGGLVALFDLRARRPTVVKDHMYGQRITDIKVHTSGEGNAGRKVISADTRIVKVWGAADGAPYTSIEPPGAGDINDVCVWPNSGLLMVARDTPEILPHFIPSLGPAPPWAAFLEGLTEELEEAAAPTVYDDYRFVTQQELEKLALGHLVGTPLLRAYMHGFFVDNRLYRKAKALAEPFAYETYRQQRIEAKLDAQREGRISLIRKLPKVNAALAARALPGQKRGPETEPDAVADAEGAPAKRARPGDVLTDPRFAAMFENRDFEVDLDADEYKQLHPNAEGRAKERRLIREHFRQVSDDDAEPDAAASSQDDAGLSEEEEEDEGDRGPRMYAARDAAAADAWRRQESTQAEAAQSLEARAAAAAPGRGPTVTRVGGSREMSFVPRGQGRSGGRGGSRSDSGSGRASSRRDSSSGRPPGGGRGGRGGGRGGGSGRRGGGGRGGGGRGGGGRGRSRGGGRGRR